MGGVSFGARNTIKGIASEIENIQDFNLDLELKLLQIQGELKKGKETYMQEVRESVDYDPTKDAEYEKQWDEFEKNLLEDLNQKINEAKTRNATVHIIGIIIKLILGLAVIGLFYAISH